MNHNSPASLYFSSEKVKKTDLFRTAVFESESLSVLESGSRLVVPMFFLLRALVGNGFLQLSAVCQLKDDPDLEAL